MMPNRFHQFLVLTTLTATAGLLSFAKAEDAKAQAEAATALLAKADQAFAAADYKTAMEIYAQLDGKLDANQTAMMKERIRFAAKQLSLMKERGIDPSTQPAATAGGPTIPSAAAERVPHRRPKKGETMELTLHELGNFEFDESKDSVLPEDVVALSGAKVKLPGQMMPLDQVGRVTRFILVNDLMSCCFGTAPKLQHIAYVKLPEGKWLEPTIERITVEGTLKVSVHKEDGYVLRLFEIEPTSIKFAPQ